MRLRHNIYLLSLSSVLLLLLVNSHIATISPIAFNKKDLSGVVQEAYTATYHFNVNFFKDHFKETLNYHHAPVMITREYTVSKGKAINYTDEIILHPIPQGEDLKDTLGALFATVVKESKSYISRYDSHFLDSYTGTTKEKVIEHWKTWSPPRYSKMLVLHRRNGVVSAVGEVGFNLYFREGKTWQDIFFWRGSNQALAKNIGDYYKGIIYLAFIGFSHFSFATTPSLKGLTAYLRKSNEASNHLLRKIGFTQVTKSNLLNLHYTMSKDSFYSEYPKAKTGEKSKNYKPQEKGTTRNTFSQFQQSNTSIRSHEKPESVATKKQETIPDFQPKSNLPQLNHLLATLLFSLVITLAISLIYTIYKPQKKEET